MANTRKRVFYQSENLHVSPSGATNGNLAATDVSQIHRVQSINYSFEVTRTDVNQFGQLAAIDRVIVEQPSVSLDFNYYPTTGLEESGIGLKLGTGISAVSSIIDGRADTKSYYVFTAPEGKDANIDYEDVGTFRPSDGSAGTDGDAVNDTDADAEGEVRGDIGVIALGNCFLTSYSAEGSVGEFLSASVNVEALNMLFDSNPNTVTNPTVNVENGKLSEYNAGGGVAPIEIPNNSFDTTTGASDQPAALRHGDISLHNALAGDISNFNDIVSGHAFGDMKVQNFSFSFDLGREDLQRLGSKFAFAKVIEFPATATLDLSAVVGVYTSSDTAVATSAKNPIFGVHGYLNDDSNKANLAVLCHKPNTSLVPSSETDIAGSSNASNIGMYYAIHGAKLDSQSFSSSIGDSKSVDMSFSTQIGGPTDKNNGIRVANGKLQNINT
jgi:hypothetical protein